MTEKLRAGFAPFEAYLWKERARVEIWVSRAEFHYSAEERAFVMHGFKYAHHRR